LSTSAAQSYFGFIRRVTERWAQPLYQLRKHLSLPENKHPLFEGQFSPWGTLALFSPVFAAPQPDWPDGTIATGFAFYDKHTPDCDGLSRTMRAFLDSGPPPIVFTLGSSAAYAPGPFYETAAVAATKLGKRAILLAGMDYRNRISVRSGGDVLVEEYAPFSKLFPHAVAIVHSGGIGTTAQVLRAGKPSIVTPFSHDQPDNGARIQRIRAGAVLPKWRLGPHALSRALDRLLSNNEVSANAAEIGTLIRAESGARAAADALERMASGHKPFSAAARM
jgi:UDP:flavonoid glycosyltransferase YjiC (YdhE family)